MHELKVVRRSLDRHNRSKLPRIAQVIGVLGRRRVIGMKVA